MFAGFSPTCSSPHDIYDQPGFFSSSSIATESGRRFARHAARRFAAKPLVVIRNGVLPERRGQSPIYIST